MEDISKLVEALNNLEQSSGFAQKYGPYFFAIALLTVMPFVARAVLNGSLTKRGDPETRKKAYEDFRFYFRLVVITGIACIVFGVFWWARSSNREDERTASTVADLQSQLEKLTTTMKTMNFAAFGVIGPGVKAQDVFYQTQINDRLSIVFAKLPSPLAQSEASWLFVVLSDKELPSTLDFSVGWSQVGENNEVPTAPTLMPIHLTAAKHYSVYKFSLDGDSASISPVDLTN